MAGNSFGTIFKLTSFGESHGAAIGGILDGCPAGLEIDEAFIQQELNRRKPGQSSITTPRNEEDKIEFLSGIFEGKSTGTPIAFIVRNSDAESKDYSHLKDSFRPGHADFTFEKKFGLRDYRGGGRSSARETISRVVGGAIAKLLLKKSNISINAFVKQVGSVSTEKHYSEFNFNSRENSVRCPDTGAAEKMISLIEEVKQKGDSIGGIIQCVIKNIPVGLGEPVFDKLHARLAYAMMGINAVKGFEIGEGFNSVTLKGSEMNDQFVNTESGISTNSNHSGGIQGGISNGNDVYFNLAFKPVSTIMQTQKSVNSSGEEVFLEGKGRHDSCVLPRAVPIVESMSALVIADFLLLARLNKL